MATTDKMIKLLVVDDDKVDREMISRLLLKSSNKYHITEASSVDEGLEFYDTGIFDAVLLDYRMPQRSGIEMIIELRTHIRNYGSAIVVLSSAEDEELATRCIKAGAQDFLPKSEISTSRIQNALTHAQTRFELEMQLKESYLTSKKIAERDALTGLANRYVFDESLQVAVANNGRSEFKLGLILFDIDNFKHINDIHGHDAGDEVLIEIANRVSKSLRENELFSRIGGDEFAIMITNLKDIYHLNSIANRVISAVEAPVKTQHTSLKIELSIGIAIHPDNSEDGKELTKCSDIALYRAKTKRGNQVCFFYPEMQEKLLRRYEVEQALHDANKDNGFILFYQPMVSVVDQSIIGFEALLRLKNNDNLKCFPDEFIPIAEESGIISEIGDWVIDTAISQLSLWNKKYNKKLTMSINLSAVQIESETLIDTIWKNITQYRIDPATLEFEITETALLNSSDLIVSIIQSIRALGCKVALDDFGTGYSSISHLLFPISSIKLDKSIMPSSTNDHSSKVLVEAVIAMANKLELNIVAEGIEEKFQLDFVKENGVHRAQGYYFNKPLAPNDIETLMKL